MHLSPRILSQITIETIFTKHIILKIGSILFLLLISISFGFMPYFISFCRKSNKFLSLSNSFSAGIFLGLGFFHILPEAAEILHKKTEFPLAYVCCSNSGTTILLRKSRSISGLRPRITSLNETSNTSSRPMTC